MNLTIVFLGTRGREPTEYSRRSICVHGENHGPEHWSSGTEKSLIFVYALFHPIISKSTSTNILWQCLGGHRFDSWLSQTKDFKLVVEAPLSNALHIPVKG